MPFTELLAQHFKFCGPETDSAKLAHWMHDGRMKRFASWRRVAQDVLDEATKRGFLTRDAVGWYRMAEYRG